MHKSQPVLCFSPLFSSVCYDCNKNLCYIFIWTLLWPIIGLVHIGLHTLIDTLKIKKHSSVDLHGLLMIFVVARCRRLSCLNNLYPLKHAFFNFNTQLSTITHVTVFCQVKYSLYYRVCSKIPSTSPNPSTFNPKKPWTPVSA